MKDYPIFKEPTRKQIIEAVLIQGYTVEVDRSLDMQNLQAKLTPRILNSALNLPHLIENQVALSISFLLAAGRTKVAGKASEITALTYIAGRVAAIFVRKLRKDEPIHNRPRFALPPP